MNGAYAAVIPKRTSSMMEREDVFINGETSCDFCYIDNSAQMNMLAATALDDAKNMVYSMVLCDCTTLNELYVSIQKTLGENGVRVAKELICSDFFAGARKQMFLRLKLS